MVIHENSANMTESIEKIMQFSHPLWQWNPDTPMDFSKDGPHPKFQPTKMVTSEQYSLSFCMCCMGFQLLRPNISIQSSKLFIDARNCCRLNLQALGSSNYTTVVENFYVCIEKHVLWKKHWNKQLSRLKKKVILTFQLHWYWWYLVDLAPFFSKKHDSKEC